LSRRPIVRRRRRDDARHPNAGTAGDAARHGVYYVTDDPGVDAVDENPSVVGDAFLVVDDLVVTTDGPTVRALGPP
jgi:hypothetical protein